MRRDVALSGLCGLGIAASVYLSAVWTSQRLAFSFNDDGVTAGLFTVLLLIALAEIPMMVYALRRLVLYSSTPLFVVLGTNAAYVAFAAVYAMIYILATHEGTGGRILAAITVLRFLSGLWIR